MRGGIFAGLVHYIPSAWNGAWLLSKHSVTVERKDKSNMHDPCLLEALSDWRDRKVNSSLQCNIRLWDSYLLERRGSYGFRKEKDSVHFQALDMHSPIQGSKIHRFKALSQAILLWSETLSPWPCPGMKAHEMSISCSLKISNYSLQGFICKRQHSGRTG